MTRIKEIVQAITKKYKTNNPFELADYMGVNVIHWDLHEEINGFYKYDKRNKYIFINRNLDDPLQKFTCAHEFGHSQLHPRLNTPFLRKNTLYSTSRIEQEANTFAIELLVPDRIVHENYHSTIYEMATAYGIPEEVVQLKNFKQKIGIFS
ncbi:ImmA/IrrE family metallo-endopeptidase [Bacillus sp. B15-48]|uniref:ImmA/IrrE family metallo-endopeptidase n=1 Tax=Bacillus sp. B15-48 TaxID=1548601 RepID=UPI00193F433F|nr:ImmA/IrrE family metallo-endopeptidase [Bacillus sp. B15-48]MBM4762748.1 ImmA/IrrE family metallo-endopeptidase [Bacillus sp. B15-48]